MVTSEDLRFFMQIAANNSLAAAARALNVTPPTVTQRLQALEAKLGIKLVDRRARAAKLTDEGELLAERARGILDEMQDLQESLASRASDVSGTLKVLAPLGFGNDYVAPLIAQFQQRYANIKVELTLSDSPNYAKGSAWDLMIYIGELLDSSLKMVPLAANRRFICASPEYLAEYGRPRTPADLTEHRCISLQENAEDVTMWRFVNTHTKADEPVRIKPTLICNEGRVVKQWALDGQGIIVRSEWDVAAQLRSGKLELLLPDYELPSANIVALLGSDYRGRSARTVMFLQQLQALLTSKPWQR